MIRRTGAAALLLAALLAPRALAESDAEVLAAEAFPEVSRLAVAIAGARWETRADELVAGAPLTAKPGAAWKKGDPHFDAARSAMLAAIEGWAAEVAASAESKQVVARKLAASLDETKAKAMRAALAAEATKEYPALCDAMHAGVAFANARRDLKAGSPEFSKAWAAWLATLGLATPRSTPELDALMRSPEGMAYATGRGAAIDALVTRLDGAVQLRFHDAQQSILAGIDAKARECAKAKHDR